MQDERHTRRTSDAETTEGAHYRNVGSQPAYHLPQSSVEALQGFLLNMQQQQQGLRASQEQGMQPQQATGGSFPSPAVKGRHGILSLPVSPAFGINLDSAIMWAAANSPTMGDLSNAGWEDTTRFETPARQAGATDMVFSPTPGRRSGGIALPTLPPLGQGENGLPDATQLLNSLAAWQAQQQSQEGSTGSMPIKPVPSHGFLHNLPEALGHHTQDSSSVGPDSQSPRHAGHQLALVEVPPSMHGSLPGHALDSTHTSSDPQQDSKNRDLAAETAIILQTLLQHHGMGGGGMRGAHDSRYGPITEDTTPPRGRDPEEVAGDSKAGSRRRNQQAASDSEETSMDVSGVRGSSGPRGGRGANKNSKQERAARAAMRAQAALELERKNSFQSPPEVMMALGSGGSRRSGCSAGTSMPPPAPINMPELRTCHCKKSQCLKLYCDCFAAGVYCSGCACQECYNRPEHASKVQERRDHIIQRDPKAFMLKIQRDSAQERHKKGCNCKRSHCLKKYCECFQGGVKCSDACKCLECMNQEDRNPPPPGLPPAPYLGLPANCKILDSSAGLAGMSFGMGSGMSTPKGTRSQGVLSGKGGDMQMGGMMGQVMEEMPRRNTPNTLRYPHSMLGVGDMSGLAMVHAGGSNGNHTTCGSLRSHYESDGMAALGLPAPVHVKMESNLSPQEMGMVGMERARSVEVPPRDPTPTRSTHAPMQPHPHDDPEHLLHAPPEDLGGDENDPSAAAMHANGQEMMSPLVPGGMTARLLHGPLFGGGMLGLGSPGSLPLDTLMGGAGEDQGHTGTAPMWQAAWGELLPLNPGGTPGAGTGGAPWQPVSAEEATAKLAGVLQWMPAATSNSGAAVTDTGDSPYSTEQGGVHALVSPVRTGRRTVGVKRTLNNGGGGGAAGASAAGGSAAAGTTSADAIPTSPALDALATVAAAERRGAGLLSDNINGQQRGEVLLLPQSPSKRTAFGSGSQPSRGTGTRNPALPPLSTRQPLQTLQQQPAAAGQGQLQQRESLGEAGQGLPGARARLQTAHSGQLSQSSVGSPAATGSGGSVPAPPANARDALKAQANDYIASRTRGTTPQLPPLSVSAIAVSIAAGNSKPTSSNGGMPVAPPSHPAPGMACRPTPHTSLTSSATTLTTAPPPLHSQASHTTLTTHPSGQGVATTSHSQDAGHPSQPSGRASMESEVRPGGGTHSSLGEETHMEAGDPASAQQAQEGDPGHLHLPTDEQQQQQQLLGSSLDLLQAMGTGTPAMAMICGTPFGDGTGDRLDALMMSPMTGWDPGLLLMSPRMATPLYAKAGGAATGNPFLTLSPNRWWPGGAAGAGGSTGPGPMSIGPLSPGQSRGVLVAAAAGDGAAAAGESAAGGGSTAADPGASLLTAGQLFRITPGTTVLSPARVPGVLAVASRAAAQGSAQQQ